MNKYGIRMEGYLVFQAEDKDKSKVEQAAEKVTARP